MIDRLGFTLRIRTYNSYKSPSMHTLKSITIPIIISACSLSTEPTKNMKKLEIESLKINFKHYKKISITNKQGVTVAKTKLAYTHYPDIVSALLDSKIKNRNLSQIIFDYTIDRQSNVYILTDSNKKCKNNFEKTNKAYTPYSRKKPKLYQCLKLFNNKINKTQKQAIDISYTEETNTWTGYFAVGTFYIPTIRPKFGINSTERSWVYQLLRSTRCQFQHNLICDYRQLQIDISHLSDIETNTYIINMQNDAIEYLFLVETNSLFKKLHLLFTFSDDKKLRKRYESITCSLPRKYSEELQEIERNSMGYVANFNQFLYHIHISSN